MPEAPSSPDGRWSSLPRVNRAGLKRIAKRSRLAVIGVRVAGDRASQLRNRLGISTKHMGATHMNFDLATSLDYIDLVYRDFLDYAKLAPADLQGARVLELGPGDNFGIPLAFLGDGAEQVTTIDRFFSWRDDRQQLEIYNAMFERMEGEHRERAKAALANTSPLEFDPALLRVIEGTGVEEATAMLGHGSFDLIVSRAVLEHVSNDPGPPLRLDGRQLRAPQPPSRRLVPGRDAAAGL